MGYNIKMELKELEWNGVDWVKLARVWSYVELWEIMCSVTWIGKRQIICYVFVYKNTAFWKGTQYSMVQNYRSLGGTIFFILLRTN